ncbi:MAG: MBL fold metallo-hydrolase [bacterium]|nr:MBL fold metallo-hydrolase [bacterium]
MFIAILAVVLDCVIWYRVVSGGPVKSAEFHVLDVGQGDSTLLIAPPGMTILTDAGPDQKVLTSLSYAMPWRRSLDIAVITHPQLDHFNGFYYILDHYRVGAIVINGRTEPGVPQWDALLKKVREKHIPLVTLAAGDRIRYGSTTIEILSPTSEWVQSGELNDTGIVEYVRTPDFTALLAADIGANVEGYLAKLYGLKADILKVGHHGSKYSSSDAFVRAVDPKVAGIGVGARNNYGHPSPEALARLASSTSAKIFRTDKHGTISIIGASGTLRVFTER